MNKTEISIVGAGPIGNYLAYLLARVGKKVGVYEEHKQIGKPVQCAGIVTSSIKKILDFSIDPCIKNKIKKIEIHSKNNKCEFKLKNPDIILDREKFDKIIYEKAKQAGAKFYLGKKVKKFDFQEILVGADGPTSLISKAIGNKNKFGFAIQARVKIKTKIKDKSKLFIFLKPKSFVWIIPESNTIARIGMIGKDIKQLKPFLRGKILEWQFGIIPFFSKSKKIHQNNIYLVGDAAGQIKETTYGGIVPGLLGAKALANAIINKNININKNRASYEKNLRKLNRELWIHHKIRQILNKFSDKDYDLLVKFVNNSKIKKILEETDRDNMKKIAWKLFLLEPRFFYFIKFLF
jgi:flavin-dependent dehydrogenase